MKIRKGSEIWSPRLALRACGAERYDEDAKSVRAPNKVFKRRRSVHPYLVDGRTPRAPARCGARLRHIALARKPSLNASGLLLWARATS